MTAEDDIDDSSAPLIEHLAELRNRLIKSAVAFIAAMCVCFAFADPIFNFLSVPVCNALADRGQDCSLVMIKLQEGFFVAIRISFLGGFALAFPYIGYQLWRFIAPGLYRSEKNAFLPFLIASPFMFIAGAAFAYYIILPMAFDFFLGYQKGLMHDTAGAVGAAGDAAGATGDAAGSGAGEALTKAGILYQGSIEEYLALTIKFIMAFGLCFQLPVLLTLMGKAGLVSSEGLGSVRKYAVVGILLLAAIATPPDVISQVVLFTVVYGLYEVSIFLVRGIERRRAAEEAAEEAELDGTAAATTDVAAAATTTPAEAEADLDTAELDDEPEAPGAEGDEPKP